MILTILEEARYRLTCCRAKTGDGWGDLGSLRNHLRCSVGPRLHELKPFVQEIEGLGEMSELRTDLSTVNLMYEYHDLVGVRDEIRFYLQVDLPKTQAEHHVLPPDATEVGLGYIIRKADPGDYIHCNHESYQKLVQTERHRAQEKRLTFIFPEPPWYLEDGIRKPAL